MSWEATDMYTLEILCNNALVANLVPMLSSPAPKCVKMGIVFSSEQCQRYNRKGSIVLVVNIIHTKCWTYKKCSGFFFFAITSSSLMMRKNIRLSTLMIPVLGSLGTRLWCKWFWNSTFYRFWQLVTYRRAGWINLWEQLWGLWDWVKNYSHTHQVKMEHVSNYILILLL